MAEDFDAPYFDEDCFLPRTVPTLHVQGGRRSQKERALLFVRARVHMVMKLRACSFVEAYRHLKRQDALEKEDANV